MKGADTVLADLASPREDAGWRLLAFMLAALSLIAAFPPQTTVELLLRDHEAVLH